MESHLRIAVCMVFIVVSFLVSSCYVLFCSNCNDVARTRNRSGRVLDSRPRGRGFEPHRRHCVVSLSKNINPSLVLVQPRKTRPIITEILLIGRKELNQIKSSKNAEKATHIKGRLLDEAVVLSNCVPFQNGNFS